MEMAGVVHSSVTNKGMSEVAQDDKLFCKRKDLMSNQLVQEKALDFHAFCSSFIEGKEDPSAFANEVEDLLKVLRSEDVERSSTKPARKEKGHMSGMLSEDNSESRSKNDKLGLSVDAAMCNELVLKNLFKYLSIRDLKDCKQVNKVWNKVCNETMAGRYTFIKWKQEAKKRRKFDCHVNELRACMEQNEHCWPAPGIYLDYDAWVSNPQAHRFMQNFGASIKRVTALVPAKAGMLTLLEESLPNVESIELIKLGGSQRYFIGTDTLLFSKGVVLPRLKCITLPENIKDYKYISYTFRAILSAAVNLKVIQNVNSSCTEDLVLLNKLNTVQNLDLVVSKAYLTEKAAATKFPNLKGIRVVIEGGNWNSKSPSDSPRGIERTRLLKLCKNFLILHQDTLMEMEFPPVSHMLEVLPPQMPYLRSLRLHECPSTPDVWCPFKFLENSQEVFPVLKEVYIRSKLLPIIPPRRQTTVILTDGSFPRVDAVLCGYGSRVFNNVSKFQYVTSLHIHLLGAGLERTNNDDEEDPSKRSCGIWDLKLPLKVFEIIEFSLEKHMYPDSVFTGLHREICDKLRVRPKADLDFEILRTESSICNYKDLRKFKLVISNVADEQNRIGVLSHVSQWYGFGCIPDLEVVISYDFRHSGAPKVAKAIEDIRRFVRVAHEEIGFGWYQLAHCTGCRNVKGFET